MRKALAEFGSAVCRNTRYRHIKDVGAVEIGCGRKAAYIWVYWKMSRFGHPLKYTAAICRVCHNQNTPNRPNAAARMLAETGHLPEILQIPSVAHAAAANP